MAKGSKDNERKVTIIERTGEDFFMNEYFSYAKYSIENRALPSIIDGLKPGARKIMHAGFKMLKTDKPTAFIDLVGSTLSISKYHHGDASLLTTIMTLSAQYADSLAPLKVIGSDGELRTPDSAAPRYLKVQLSKFAKILQKDQHILDYNYDGDFKVEPKYYLPIIPLVLVSRTSGISVGYKYDAQVSYNPANIVEQCISVIETGHLSGKLRPHIEQFGGKFEQHGDRIWAEGYFQVHKDHIVVNEFAPNTTFAGFEANLKKLLEEGKITNWSNDRQDEEICYTIHVNPTLLERQVQKKLLKKTYMLGEFLKRPTYTLLNEHGKIAIFQNAEDILKYFVEFRLGLYDKLKTVNIANLNERISRLSQIRMFIDMYLKGEIVMNKETKIEEVYAILDKKSIDRDVTDIPMKKLTKEEYDKLTDSIAELQEELRIFEKTPTKELYLTELKALLAEFKKEFPLQPFEIKEPVVNAK